MKQEEIPFEVKKNVCQDIQDLYLSGKATIKDIAAKYSDGYKLTPFNVGQIRKEMDEIKIRTFRWGDNWLYEQRVKEAEERRDGLTVFSKFCL